MPALEPLSAKKRARPARASSSHNEAVDSSSVPSDTTFSRVLNLVDPADFEAIIAGWLFEQDPCQIERLAADGKVLRGTGRGDGLPIDLPIALLSLVTHQLRTTLRVVISCESWG